MKALRRRVVVVGAGPAGIAAAAALAAAPLDVVLVDEGSAPGGQVYRAPAPGLDLDLPRLLGAGYAAYARFRTLAAATCARVDYRPGTAVWTVQGGAAHLASQAGIEALPYDALVLATGATDRIMPVAGWTLPGVFTLGAAQVLLKGQGCLIGRRTVFCGSSPLLYLAATQYLRAGGAVAAILDSTVFAAKTFALPRLLGTPTVLAEGLRLMAALRRAGVPILHGATVERFEGGDRLSGVTYRTARGRAGHVACDAAAYGHGLRPETQLAEVAGCALRYDPVHRLHWPAVDGAGRLGGGIYAAGDGAALGGAQAAALSGALAAQAALVDFGLRLPCAAPGRQRLRRLRRFQDGLAAAFAWPSRAVAQLGDDVTLCRCESVTVAAVRAALRQAVGPAEANAVKAATRCGMGRCQGRFCGPALVELIAAEASAPQASPGRLRAQPPVKPLPIGLAADALAGP